MTTLISWIGVDSRGPSSLYLASDSRFTWEPSNRWDRGRKLFACQSEPDLFGYSGDVLFPALTLGQAVELADHGALFSACADPQGKHDRLVELLRDSFLELPAAHQSRFSVLHASRGDEDMRAAFHVWVTTWTTALGWRDSELSLPVRSGLAYSDGSGGAIARAHIEEWHRREGERTSRAVFGGLCDALASNADPGSGGAPQLAALKRTGRPEMLGVIYGRERYLSGVPVRPWTADVQLEWRNELFERCDGETMELMVDAQPHARPRGLAPRL